MSSNDLYLLRLRTPRLELIAATHSSVEWELSDLERLATSLGAQPIIEWPPPLNDENSQRWYLQLLQERPEAVGWGLWYMIQCQPIRTVVGVAGFKGIPADGACEVGYSVLPAFQGQGYATEAVRALIHWAFDRDLVDRVLAETLPNLHPSIRVMEKCRMGYISEGQSEENVRTIRYAVTRAEFREERVP